MLYNRYIIDHDMVYSIDFLQIDFGLACLADDVVTLLFGSLEFEKAWRGSGGVRFPRPRA